MATQELAPTSPANAIHQRIAGFQGKAYLVILALLRNPGIPVAEACRNSGVSEDSFYRWKRELPGFAQAYEDICNAAGDLRSEYASAAFLEATPDIADAMISRAKGDRKDAQRAGERILETVGVLPKGNAELPQAPVQVVTHTYVLVQRELGPQGTTVEGQTRDLPPKPTTNQ